MRPIAIFQGFAHYFSQEEILEELDRLLTGNGFEQHRIIVHIAVEDGEIDFRAADAPGLSSSPLAISHF